MTTGKDYSHLSFSERRDIFTLLSRKESVGQIAKHLGRHPSTIYREINRNKYWDDESPKMSDYYPVCAQNSYQERRRRLVLLERFPDLKQFIIEKLKQYWSPEQIAGYLKRLNKATFYACMETIYLTSVRRKFGEMQLNSVGLMYGQFS